VGHRAVKGEYYMTAFRLKHRRGKWDLDSPGGYCFGFCLMESDARAGFSETSVHTTRLHDIAPEKSAIFRNIKFLEGFVFFYIPCL
jgi:hypothetical protein